MLKYNTKELHGSFWRINTSHLTTSHSTIILDANLQPDRPVDTDIQSFLPLQPRDYLILFALSAGQRHGYGLIKDVEGDTAGAVTIDPANLYRSIKRLTKDGLVAEADAPEDDAADDDRRRYYRITPLGKRVVKAEAERLADLATLARARKLI